MKALTIRQPWAWAVVHGTKRIENRSRATNHRGPLLIHAGTSRTELGRFGWEPVPEHLRFGAVIGFVDLVDCVPLETVSAEPWAEGPWCWVLADPRPVRPFAFRGMLGLFDVPDRLIVSV